MTLSVHYPGLTDNELERHLRAALDPVIDLVAGAASDSARTEILVDGRPSRELLEAAPALRALIIPWAGLPMSIRDLLADHPRLAVHNLHHNAAPVAEHAMALLLAVARRIVPADQALRRGDWRPRYEPPRSPLLAGRQAVILGAGAIGTRIARACEGLGLRPLLVGRSARSAKPLASALATATANAMLEVHGVAELDALLPRAEILFAALPTTPETDGLLTAQRLAALPEGALFVNVGRAAVVDEAALFACLRDGPLGGAGIDVWYRYPADEAARELTAPAEHPFDELDNVVLSPHRAGHGLATARLRAEALAELLNTAARGDAMPNRVNLARGY